MKIPFPLISLQGTGAGSAITEPGDGEINLSPDVLPIVSLGVPYDGFGGGVGATTVKNSTFFAYPEQIYTQNGVNAGGPQVIATFSAGTWEIFLEGSVSADSLGSARAWKFGYTDPANTGNSPLDGVFLINGRAANVTVPTVITARHSIRFLKDGWKMCMIQPASIAGDINVTMNFGMYARRIM